MRYNTISIEKCNELSLAETTLQTALHEILWGVSAYPGLE